MDLSLSVILPAHNAQRTIAGRVQELLEVLPDLTPRFEILIVEYDSSDSTEEIATDLATEFPQVRLSRESHAQGNRQQAVDSAVHQAAGDIVFIQDEDVAISVSDLRRLWQLRYDEQLVMARSESAGDPIAETVAIGAPEPVLRQPVQTGLMERLTAWGTALRDSAQQHRGLGGIQMIRRRSLSGLSGEVRLTRMPAESATPAPRNFTSHLRDLALGE